MSSANEVPETWELTGDDAWRALQRTGRSRLLADALKRLRVADGFSHARSLAFLVSLTLVQGIIAVVGLASAFGTTSLSGVIVRTIKGAVPGPGGELLTTAVQQAEGAGVAHRYLALVLGTVGMLVSATTAMGQVERGLNRIYGVEQDRPMIQKYGLGLLLAVSAGALITVGFFSLAVGKEIGDSSHSGMLADVWGALRWPLALAAFAGGVTMLFRWCPRRHQPGATWLVFGAGVSVTLLFFVTVALGTFFRVSPTFGATYGPLAGMVALLLWSVLASMGVLFGAAVGAQLEAVRAGDAKPQDAQKAARDPRPGRSRREPARLAR